MKNILFFCLISICFMFCVDKALAGEFYQFRLENGHKFIVKQIKSNPVVVIDTWVKTGSVNEDEKNSGVAHFLEHMFFKGSLNFPKGEFDKILESKGAITNAATSKDFTHFYITIPSQNFDLAFKMHADMMQRPLIPIKEFEKEKKVVIEEISKGLDNPNNILYNEINESFYSEHPYKRKVIGKKEIIENMTRDEMLNFYKAWYVPSNFVTVIVGDVDLAQVKKLASTYFKTSRTKSCVKKNQMDLPLKKSKVKVKNLDTIKSAYYMTAFRTVPISNKDTYALDVLATILSEGKNSPLYQDLKEKNQLVYSVNAFHSSYKEDGLFCIEANFEPKNSILVNKIILNNIRDIQKGAFSQYRIDIAKKMIENETFFSRESVSNISTEIGYCQILSNQDNFYNDYLKNIKKVTKDDLKRVANQYLNLENSASTILLLPKGIYINQQELIFDCEKKQPNNILSQEEKNIEEPCRKTDLSLLLNSKSYNLKYTKQTKNSQSIQEYNLGNGLKILFSESANDIVALDVFSKGGVFLEPENVYIPTLCAQLMTKRTKNFTKDKFEDFLQENGVHLDVTNIKDGVVISLKSVKKNLDKLLTVLDEVINNSQFDQEDVLKINSQQLDRLKTIADFPMNIAFDTFKDKIWGHSLYNSSSFVLENSIKNASKADAQHFFSKNFYPKNTIISVCGKLENKDQIISILENKIFTKGNCELAKSEEVDFALTKREKVKIFKSKSNTSWIVTGFKTCGVTNKKDYITLKIIDSLLGNGMSSRLFVNLRDKEGLAYQLGSSFSANEKAGVFAVYIGTNPSSESKALSGLNYEITKLKTQFVSDKELDDAKNKLLGNIILSEQTNSQKAFSVGYFEMMGVGFNFISQYKDFLDTIKAKDIIEVSNRYFREENCITVCVSSKK